MGEYVTDLGNVQGGLDGYILEVRQKGEFVDVVTETLDKNFEIMAEALGSGAAIVRSSDDEAMQAFLSKMNLRADAKNLPLLVVMEKPPNEMDTGDKCIVFNLGNMENSTDVTKVLKIIVMYISNDDFMKQLSMEEKKLQIEHRISEVVGPVGLVISLISLL